MLTAWSCEIPRSKGEALVFQHTRAHDEIGWDFDALGRSVLGGIRKKVFLPPEWNYLSHWANIRCQDDGLQKHNSTWSWNGKECSERSAEHSESVHVGRRFRF